MTQYIAEDCGIFQLNTPISDSHCRMVGARTGLSTRVSSQVPCAQYFLSGWKGAIGSLHVHNVGETDVDALRLEKWCGEKVVGMKC